MRPSSPYGTRPSRPYRMRPSSPYGTRPSRFWVRGWRFGRFDRPEMAGSASPKPAGGQIEAGGMVSNVTRSRISAFMLSLPSASGIVVLTGREQPIAQEGAAHFGHDPRLPGSLGSGS